MDGVVKYTKKVLHGKWPEFEQKVNESPFNLAFYKSELKKSIKEPEESTEDDFSFVDDASFDVKHWIDEPEINSDGEKPEVPMI